MRLYVLPAPLVVLLASVFAVQAAAHRDPCHGRHACPSDHHSYLWRGLSCTSYADEREPNDMRTVRFDGRKYWCHNADHRPREPRQLGAAGDHADERGRQHDDPLHLVGELFGSCLPGQPQLPLGRRGDSSIAEQHAGDRRVHEPPDRIH